MRLLKREPQVIIKAFPTPTKRPLTTPDAEQFGATQYGAGVPLPNARCFYKLTIPASETAGLSAQDGIFVGPPSVTFGEGTVAPWWGAYGIFPARGDQSVDNSLIQRVTGDFDHDESTAGDATRSTPSSSSNIAVNTISYASGSFYRGQNGYFRPTPSYYEGDGFDGPSWAALVAKDMIQGGVNITIEFHYLIYPRLSRRYLVIVSFASY